MSGIEAHRNAVEKTHGGEAIFVCSIPVHVEFEGKTIWEGSASLFAIKGHPSAISCYAWSVPPGDGRGEQFYAVLHTKGVYSAAKAVRDSLIPDHAGRALWTAVRCRADALRL